MKRPKKLSAAFVKTVKRPGRDGFGLSLLVKPTATGRLFKTWSQRLRIHSHPVNVGLGAYPVVTLVEAWEKALKNRRTVAQGRDRRSGGVPMFAEAVKTVIATHRRSGSRYESQWRGTLRRYAVPRFGDKRANEVTTAWISSARRPQSCPAAPSRTVRPFSVAHTLHLRAGSLG